MGNTSPVLAGSWKERSGRVWHSTQVGNHFTWTQEGTGRVANGTIVSRSANPTSADYSIHISFDGNVHWILSSNYDGSVLQGKTDSFTRVSTGVPSSNATVYNLSGIPTHTLNSTPSHSLHAMHVNLTNVIYRENSGKTWIVQSQPHPGYIVMKNQQDGRIAHGYIVRDVSSNKYTIFIDFQGAETSFRVDTYDINNWTLQNGDSFKSTFPVSVPSSVPVYTQPSSGFNISLGNTGISFGVQPQYNQPTTYVQPTTYMQPTTTYIPPQQTYVPPPQPSFNPVVNPMYPTMNTSVSYGMSSNSLVNSLVQACQNQTFDSDKMKAVISYSQSQNCPMNGQDIIKIIGLFSFDSDKYKVIHQLKITNNIAGLDTNSTSAILRCFAHDSDKTKTVHELCPYIFDRRQNTEVIVGCFSFSSDQTKIRDYLLRN